MLSNKDYQHKPHATHQTYASIPNSINMILLHEHFLLASSTQTNRKRQQYLDANSSPHFLKVHCRRHLMDYLYIALTQHLINHYFQYTPLEKNQLENKYL